MIKNINKPTSPFWGKVQAASLLIGSSISATATVAHIEWLQITAIVFTCLGGIIPIFMPNKEQL